MNNRRARTLASLLILTLLSACTGHHVYNQSSKPQVTSSPPRSNAPAAETPYTIPSGYVKTYVVFGQRYFVLGSSEGFRETGLASWYGPKFHGRPTANGETFNRHALTAAHRSLPLPTTVRVTNLANRRSVIVRVNDRGPFVGDRIIDLSQAAAQALDMIGPGTAMVEIEALTNTSIAGTTIVTNSTATHSVTVAGVSQETVVDHTDNTATAISDTTTSTGIDGVNGIAPNVQPQSASEDDDGSSSFIQIGAFSDVNNARHMRNQLEQSGIESVIIQHIVVDNQSLHRVRIGPLVKKSAKPILQRLFDMGLTTAKIMSK